MFSFRKTKIAVPATNNTKLVDAVELWCVRWMARKGEFSHDRRLEMEAFTSEEKAKSFADALINAQKLLRHGENLSISITKNGVS